MSYTVKLAVFLPWKAPIPYETLAEEFASSEEAAEAGTRALKTITERGLAEHSSGLRLEPERAGERSVSSITVPDEAVHGYLIFDEAGVEVFNWTTLDVALDCAANARFEDLGDSFSTSVPPSTSS